MLLVAVIPLLRFFIMNISVCFLEKVKIDMFFKSSCIYINVTQFFLHSTEDPHGHPWANAGFVHDRRGTSTNVLLHPYLQDVRSSSFTTSVLLMLLTCYTTFLASLASWIHFTSWITLQLLWHTYSRSPRDYGQVPDNWLIFVDYQLVI